MKTFFAATIALSMLAAPAMAAPNDMHSGHAGQAQNSQRYNHSQPRPDVRKPQAQTHQSHDYQYKPQYSYDGQKHTAYRGPAWKAPRGHTTNRYWNRGQKLPSAYRNRSYVIDYRAYRLKQPPRGYQWVRNDRNVYLVSMNNGLISQIVLNLFY